MATTKQVTTSLIILVATVLLIGGVVYVNNLNNKTATKSSPTISATKKTTSSSPTTPTQYKDGTYTATGSYSSPDGSQQIGITMTISGDTVTSTSAQNKANGGDSSEYEDRFIASYKDVVIGKKIASLKGMVSGDSLTLIGFEDALSQIQQQAKS
jgi:uncharacterized protein with FMN-binding domain